MARKHNVLRPNRLIHPPYGSVEIDWSHPLTRGLVAWFAPHIDLVSGLTLTPGGGAGLGGFGGRPELAVLSQSGNARFAAIAPAQIKLQPPLTFALRVRVLAAPDDNSSFAGVTVNNTLSSPYVSINIGQYYNGNVLAVAYNNGSTGYIVAKANSIDFDNLAYPWVAHLVVTIPYNAAPTLVVNGAQVTLTGATAVTALAYTATAEVHVGETWTTEDRHPHAEVADFQIWNRAFSADEAKALYRDPYALLRSRAVAFYDLGSESPSVKVISGQPVVADFEVSRAIIATAAKATKSTGKYWKDGSPLTDLNEPGGKKYWNNGAPARGLRGARPAARLHERKSPTGVTTTATLTLPVSMAIAGTGAGSASAVASLGSQIPLLGAVASGLAAAAALTTAIALGGSAAGAGEASASITFQEVKNVAGSVSAGLASQGVLASSLPVAGSGYVALTTTGAIVSALPCSGSGQGDSLLGAALSTRLPLVVTCAGSASCNGDLSSAVTFAGMAASSASVVAALRAQTKLVASETGAASGTASLSSALPLIGGFQGAASASAVLASAVTCEGHVEGLAHLQGALSTAIAMQAGPGASMATQAVLWSALPLTGSVQAAAGSSGDITTRIACAAVGAVEMASGAALVTAIPLSGLVSANGAAEGFLLVPDRPLVALTSELAYSTLASSVTAAVYDADILADPVTVAEVSVEGEGV